MTGEGHALFPYHIRATRIKRTFASQCEMCSWSDESDAAAVNAELHVMRTGHAVKIAKGSLVTLRRAKNRREKGRT